MNDEELQMTARTRVLACCTTLALAGCAGMSDSEQRTLSGSAMGAAGGALVGSMWKGKPLTGAALGAAAGAVGGWLYDRHEKAQDD
jgi:uncharacterized membrane protein